MATITVVLLPGMDGSAALFEPFVTALGPQYAIRAISYPADAPLGYTELEALVRRSLPTSGSFVVLGESFSGPIAVALAASPPPGLRGVVLCCTFVRNPRPSLSCFGWLVRFAPVKLVPAALLCVALLGRDANAFWRSELANALAPVSSAALRARLRAVLSVDAAAQLSFAQVPVLYLRATQDRVVPVGATQLVTRACPAITVMSIQGPHFLLQVRPKQAAAAVQEFVRVASS